MNKFLCFVLGAAAGAGVTWYFSKRYFQKLRDEEVQSVIETFKPKAEEKSADTEEPASAQPRTSAPSYNTERRSKLQAYNALIRETHYDHRSPKERLEEDPDEPPPGDNVTKPYSISPEDFDTLDNYDVVIFTYYADDVLVDEDNEPLTVDEIIWSVGADFASHFGEYEDDSVHIRNDMRQIDYEILRDLRKYGDLNDTRPPQ